MYAEIKPLACPLVEEYMTQLITTDYTDQQQVKRLDVVCYLPCLPAVVVRTFSRVSYSTLECTFCSYICVLRADRVVWLLSAPETSLPAHSSSVNNSSFLCSRVEDQKICNDNRELLPDSVLGMNHNAKPYINDASPRGPKHLKWHLPIESKDLSNSSDYNPDAFHIFHQVGALMYYKSDFNAETGKAKRDEDNWKDTGSAVVTDAT